MVHHKDGPLLVVSSAGTGKTGVITERVKRLIDTHGVEPSRILCITFTNDAAKEMKERISLSTGIAQNKLSIYTFHGLCNTWLRKSGHLIGLNRYKIMDPDEIKHVITTIAAKHQLGGSTKKQWYKYQTVSPSTNIGDMEAKYLEHENSKLKTKKAKLVVDALSYLNKTNSKISATASKFGGDQDGIKFVHTCLSEYSTKKAQMNLLDFDDLEIKGLELFQNESIHSNYDYVLCDEAQDLSAVELDLLNALCPSKNIMAVGDGMQCQPGDTIVEAEKGPILLRDLKVGDLVWSAHPKTLKMELKRVNMVQKRKYKGIIYIVETDTSYTRATPNHKFRVWDKNEYSIKTMESVETKDITYSSVVPVVKYLKNSITTEFKTMSIYPHPYDDYVYSLDIEDYHTYVADGIVTCNSIYGFRGSSSLVLEDFCNMFSADKAYLSINFRCDKNIVDIANITTKGHREKEPTSYTSDKGFVGYIEFKDQTQELQWIMKSIKTLVSGK